MNHLLPVAALAGLSIVLPSCRPTDPAEDPATRIVLESGARRAGHDAIVVFLPKTRETQELWDSFRSELSEEFDVIPYEVTPTTTPQDLGTAIAKLRPASVVLVNNPTVRLYQRYTKTRPKDAPRLPAVVLMSSFLEEYYRQIPDAIGIAYEVPLITSVVNLRAFFEGDMRRIGVLARPAFLSYVSRQQQLAAIEGISVIELPLSEAPDDDEVSEAIEILCRKDRLDALWILNDNVLLDPEMIASAWMPSLERCSVPVIVGVRALVNPQVHFGSFAVLPDHEALGVQAADLVYELADADWEVGDLGVELPLSVRTTVDIAQARERLRFREKMLSNVDVIVE
jgi:hypothetical protein